MERLTEKHFDGNGHYMKCSGNHKCDGLCGNCEELDKIVNSLAAYEDTGYTPKDFDRLCREMSVIRTSLGVATYDQLCKMARDGRLLVLPCAIGSTVYVIGHRYRNGWDECWINPGKFRPSDLEKIGDRVFFTYEGAKEKILSMNKGNPRFRFIETRCHG